MYNIALICTIHKEFGKCNSDELYTIIHSIRPDVVFEEMSPDLFDRVYMKNQFSEESLETKSIKRYLQNYDIKHFPVDIDITKNISVEDYHRMHHTFKQHDVYRKLDYEYNVMLRQKGFSYLNSKECEIMIDKMKLTEKNLIESVIIQNRIIDSYKLFDELSEKRENKIIENICNYSNENQYNQALLLIGVGHRKSIIEKIRNYKNQVNIKLNWTFYGS
jgi:hypothetical protein